MPKDILRVDTDITDVMGFAGAIDKIEEVVKSAKYKNSILAFAHSRLSEAFDSYADAVAGSTDSLNHMYEWGMAGSPAARLWGHKLSGAGGNKSATFVFLASKKAIPTPKQRQSNSRDPISLVSPDEISKLSNRRYVYYWKAPIAEYNIPVTIKPKYGKKLFVPLFNVPRNFVFVNVVTRSGISPKYIGRFTGLWAQWWSTVAESEFRESVQKSLESDLVEPVNDALKRKRSKSVSLSYVSDNQAAFRAGQAIAQQYFNKKINTYSRAKKVVIGDYWNG